MSDNEHDDLPEMPTTGTAGELLQSEIIHAEYVDRGDHGYQHTLSNLQIQMIAIGGAVGVGLFLGVGARIKGAGPALLVSYFIVSVVVYLLMRAVGEMVMYRPTTGAFVSYAREFVSPWLAHITGWTYVTLGCLGAIAEVSAIAIYMGYWYPDAPGWIWSFVALCLILGSNLFSARAFGFIEFGASAVKVVAIVLFILAGLVIVLLGMTPKASVSNLWGDGGFAPNGWLPVILVMQGVVFSYSAIEIVGISAGEAADPHRSIPIAVRSVVYRIAIFYLGAILVLAMLLPWSDYSGKESPFVTALASLNIPGLAGIMNFVVLTAAISGVNATIYAGGRLLRNLAANGMAPAVTTTMSRRGVPVGSLFTFGLVVLFGILLIFFAGATSAFEIILGAAAVAILFGWIAIFISHIGYRRAVAAGRVRGVSFKMPGYPATSYLCLAFLVIAYLSMTFDFSNPHWYFNVIATLVLVGGHSLTYIYYRAKVARHGLPKLDAHLEV